MIIILFILLIGGFFGFAILLAGIALHAMGNAKKQARLIMEGAGATDKEINRIKKILSTAQNDTEAAYLWRKLEELNSK